MTTKNDPSIGWQSKLIFTLNGAWKWPSSLDGQLKCISTDRWQLKSISTIWFMIAPLKEEILRFESLSKNHCSIYFPSSPRANVLILFAKFCTMLSTFWKVGETFRWNWSSLKKLRGSRQWTQKVGKDGIQMKSWEII
jgi:hypothetical protein